MAAAFHRRRHHDWCLVPGLPVPSSASTAALLLVVVFLAVLSFLAPPLLDHPLIPVPLHKRHQYPPLRTHPRPPVLILNPSELKKDMVVHDKPFIVPNGGGSSGSDLWVSKQSMHFYGCSNSSNFPSAETVTVPNRYLMIATSGGLNQQRTGITDAVVAARILNATLVIPKLDQKSFWKDTSNFSEIFDVDWFIISLWKDVKIVKELPKKGGKYFNSPHSTRVPRKCTPKCYQNRVLPILLKRHVVQLTKFDYRLSNNLDTDLQKLRCRVNYHALTFTRPILEMGDLLIRRMRAKSKHFIALHLRFEPDMLAFSGCYYGGGDKEIKEFSAIRKRWKTLHSKDPDRERRHGKCPLTPEEVGLMLRALGFGSEVHIYVASGEVYGGEETLAPLKALFPNYHSKETLATKDELEPFSSFSSRMAALDFFVCDGSDVFVTNNNGNMARILAGRRRYFGHKRTIRPNARKLSSLFLNRANTTWEAFVSKVKAHQIGFMGEPNEVRPGRGEFHENPAACLCEKSPGAAVMAPGFQNREKSGTKNGMLNKYFNDFSEEHFNDQESEWIDMDESVDESYGKGILSKSGSEYDITVRTEEPELEEILSD